MTDRYRCVWCDHEDTTRRAIVDHAQATHPSDCRAALLNVAAVDMSAVWVTITKDIVDIIVLEQFAPTLGLVAAELDKVTADEIVRIAVIMEPAVRYDKARNWNESGFRDIVRAVLHDHGYGSARNAPDRKDTTYVLVWDPDRDQTEDESFVPEVTDHA